MAMQSLTATKNQSLLTLLLSKSNSAGKMSTVTNIAKSVSTDLFDSFFSARDSASLRQRVFQMQHVLAGNSNNQQLQPQTFQQSLDAAYVTQEQAFGSQTSESATITETTGDPDSRLNQNLRQAADVVKQLGLTADAWGVESLARDLALFDLDFTAMNGNPHDLAETIRQKAQALVADIDSQANGTGVDMSSKRREITGASSRLISAMQGAAGAVARASVSLEGSMASSRTTVSVGGARVDATAIVAAANVIVDPIVFDMNGDGFNFKGADEGVDFDMKGNGQESRMGFIKGDDALLFVDTHGDGVVRDGRQLFGNNGDYANGFEMLRAYDENGDGVIDENDSIYDQLRLWVEKTEDGVCETDETISLRDAGIKSINVGYQDVREDDGKGNLIGQVGSFTRDDGSKGAAVDVWFQALANRP